MRRCRRKISTPPKKKSFRVLNLFCINYALTFSVLISFVSASFTYWFWHYFFSNTMPPEHSHDLQNLVIWFFMYKSARDLVICCRYSYPICQPCHQHQENYGSHSSVWQRSIHKFLENMFLFLEFLLTFFLLLDLLATWHLYFHSAILPSSDFTAYL